MISLRQHAISLVAVFLALAVGLVIGSGFLGGSVGSVSGGDDKRISDLENDKSRLQNQLNAANEFDNAVTPRLLKGALRDRSVLVVTTPGADDGDVAAVKQALTSSGAQLTGQLGLTDPLLADQSSEKVRTIVDQSIPAGQTLRTELTDTGGRVGDLLGLLLQQKGDNTPVGAGDRTAGLQALRDGGFVQYNDKALNPAQTVVVVTGGEYDANAGARGQVVAQFSAAFAARGDGGVLVGRTGSAEGTSPIAVLRSDTGLASKVASVDDVDQPTGRITAALALADATRRTVGAYGTGTGAKGVTVAN
ncbi:copper transporter [Williamsia sterculiae]|uniref:Copper transport outer membrane protein, MctB n=1 Tax=Williamsia sterculiae TaxID=1344003 RepID=A0A1N7H436_9NOCA|nr:copper transporter [Williamsia sterculiae]SIS19586.1 Copper transport outer membrane protein, MctB [Williamsia sterculiae]